MKQPDFFQGHSPNYSPGGPLSKLQSVILNQETKSFFYFKSHLLKGPSPVPTPLAILSEMLFDNQMVETLVILLQWGLLCSLAGP